MACVGCARMEAVLMGVDATTAGSIRTIRFGLEECVQVRTPLSPPLHRREERRCSDRTSAPRHRSEEHAAVILPSTRLIHLRWRKIGHKAKGEAWDGGEALGAASTVFDAVFYTGFLLSKVSLEPTCSLEPISEACIFRVTEEEIKRILLGHFLL